MAADIVNRHPSIVSSHGRIRSKCGLKVSRYLPRLPRGESESSSTFEKPAGTSNLQPSTAADEKFDISMVISIKLAEPPAG